MIVFGILLIIYGLVAGYWATFFFGDIKLAGLIGAIAAVFSGMGFIRVHTKLKEIYVILDRDNN